MLETQNAIIESTILGFEDHGIMTFSLELKYGECTYQNAGGYCLSPKIQNKDEKLVKEARTTVGIKIIMRILEVVGVDNWEDLKGKYIRVKNDDSGVHEIGNLLKDDWLNFKDFFNENNNG